MHAEPAIHASMNRREGSLADTPLRDLLEPCRRHQVCGRITVESAEGRGLIQLRSGVVDHASFGLLVGDAAVIRMSLLREGIYHLEQQVPDIGGQLARAAAMESDVARVPLSVVMRHCEDNKLTCSITVVSGYDRGELRYHIGDLVEVALNGIPDPDCVVHLLRWHDARYRVALEPLSPEIAGWPRVSRATTVPAEVGATVPPQLLPRVARGTGPVPVDTTPRRSAPMAAQPALDMIPPAQALPPAPPPTPRRRALTERDKTPAVDMETFAARVFAEPLDEGSGAEPAPPLSRPPRPPPEALVARPYQKPRKRARTNAGNELPLQPPMPVVEAALFAATAERLTPRRGAVLTALVFLLFAVVVMAVGLGLIGQ
jgi:hypothetical protein